MTMRCRIVNTGTQSKALTEDVARRLVEGNWQRGGEPEIGCGRREPDSCRDVQERVPGEDRRETEFDDATHPIRVVDLEASHSRRKARFTIDVKNERCIGGRRQQHAQAYSDDVTVIGVIGGELVDV